MKIYKIAKEKILIIMRGCPGSGKSTLAQKLGKEGVVLSTDNYFEQDGQYNFNPIQLPEAHTWNYFRALNAMKRGVSPIVIDNNTIEAWEARPYVIEGLRYGYKIHIQEPITPWKFNLNELTKQNKHQVPAEVIQKKLEKWQPDITVEDIIKSKTPETL